MKRVTVAALFWFPVILVVAWTLWTAQAVSQAGQLKAGQPQGQQLVFRNQIVMDQQGLNLEAFRILVPKDWIFDGGITWNFSKNPPEPFTIFTVTSPDGGSVI